MTTSGFPGHAARSSSGGLELVHVESGAVLASAVRIGPTLARRSWAWLRRRSSPGEESALVVFPARWVHTFFASFPTDVAFVAEDGKVLKVRRGLKPWRVAFAPKAAAAIQAAPGFLARTRTRVNDRVILRDAQAARPVRDVDAWRTDDDNVPESVRAAFRDSVAAGLEDSESGADPWGVEPDSAMGERPDKAAAAPTAFSPPERPRDHGPARVETAAGLRTKPAPARAPARGVDLATLTARQTPLAWFEAVAIFQEMCAVLLAGRRGRAPEEFELQDVAITAEGTVEMRGGSSHGHPTVAQAGHVLLTLLGEAQTLPVQLRLLALQEVSPTPRCSTLGELSTQLAVFERPNRQATIREVYERFLALPPAPVEEPAAPEAAPRRTARTRATGASLWRNRRVRTAAVAAALVVVLVVAATLVWQAAVPMFSDGAKAGAADRDRPGSASLPEEVVERIRAAARRIWLGAETPRAAPVPTAIPDAKPAGPSPPATKVKTAAANPAEPVDVPVAGADAHTPAADPTVFTAANADVDPAVLMRPHLPASPRPGVRLEDLPEVELVVSASGEVESVKLLTPAAGVHPAMMLSAIKTWYFRPAMKNGKPVRYRLTLRLTNQ